MKLRLELIVDEDAWEQAHPDTWLVGAIVEALRRALNDTPTGHVTITIVEPPEMP